VAGLSKLNSVTWLESQGRGRRYSRRAGVTGRPCAAGNANKHSPSDGSDAYRSKSSGIP
jgi:hypothetical protein